MFFISNSLKKNKEKSTASFILQNTCLQTDLGHTLNSSEGEKKHLDDPFTLTFYRLDFQRLLTIISAKVKIIQLYFTWNFKDVPGLWIGVV